MTRPVNNIQVRPWLDLVMAWFAVSAGQRAQMSWAQMKNFSVLKLLLPGFLYGVQIHGLRYSVIKCPNSSKFLLKWSPLQRYRQVLCWKLSEKTHSRPSRVVSTSDVERSLVGFQSVNVSIWFDPSYCPNDDDNLSWGHETRQGI